MLLPFPLMSQYVNGSVMLYALADETKTYLKTSKFKEPRVCSAVTKRTHLNQKHF